MDKHSMAKWLVASGVTAVGALSGSYLLIPHEGEHKRNGVHVAYLDAVGVPTACYGQTGHDLYGKVIRAGMKYTDQECADMLAKTIIAFEKQIKPLVKVDYKSPYQQASLLSFTYNVGVGNLSKSTLLRLLNNNEHDKACDQLSNWVYAQKKKLGGLVTRRKDEYDWCMGYAPYEAKVTYGNLVDMVKDTTPRY